MAIGAGKVQKGGERKGGTVRKPRVTKADRKVNRLDFSPTKAVDPISDIQDGKEGVR